MRNRSLMNWFIAPLLALALTGCFESKDALIAPEEADFPFSALTYADSDGKKYTLTRIGDNYINSGEDENSAIRLKAVDANTYVGQIVVVTGGVKAYQYALIRVAEDGKGFSFAHSVANEQAKLAAAKGEYGFRACGETIVCIGSLEGFVEFATSMPESSEKTSIFTIKEMKLN